MLFGHDLSFWVSALGATIVRLAMPPPTSIWRAFLTAFAAIFAAYVFTEPAIDWLALDPDTYTAPLAALLALTGEGIMRMLMATSNDPSKLIELWRAWRGK